MFLTELDLDTTGAEALRIYMNAYEMMFFL